MMKKGKSKDSLDQSLDSLESGDSRTDDSLEILHDSLGRSQLTILPKCFFFKFYLKTLIEVGITENLCDEMKENNMIQILDKDLESVIEQATKLQHKVLESIIGGRTAELAAADERTEGMTESIREPSEIMNVTEAQLKTHQSEKITFSKGIASIIYNKSEEEQNLLIADSEQERKNSEEKNDFANESIELLQEEKSEEVKVSLENFTIH